MLEGRAGVIFDLGAGPGSLVRQMAARLPQFVVIGLDISLSMTRRGKERLRAEGVKNALFVVADVHRLPFKSRSMDVIISHGSMHHWSWVDIALAEIKRVMAEEGFIYMSDLRRDAPKEAIQKIAGILNKSQARAFLNSVRAAYTIEELSALVEKAGLKHVRVEPEDFSRRAIARNIRKLKESPMRGLRQAAINLRLVGGSG